MSISLSVGTHTVTVSVESSGWNPDVRTITIVSGNNDLSVTFSRFWLLAHKDLRGRRDRKGTGASGAAGPQGPTGPQGPQGPAGTADIPSSRSYLFRDEPVPANTDHTINWDQIQTGPFGAYDTFGAIQTSPWRFVAPSAGRHRVSTFIRYRPNGSIAASQIIQIEVYLNGHDWGSLGGFQAGNNAGEADLFFQGEDEIICNAGDQFTIHISQNTGQTGYATTASHVLVARTGNWESRTSTKSHELTRTKTDE